MTEDRQFERLLRSAATRGRAADACPDPEQLAAFADGSLERPDRTAVERHAADCVRCTEHLALLANLEPAPAGVSAEGSVGRWAWLVPVATAVLVFAVWTRTGDAPEPQTSLPEVAEQQAVGRSQAEPPRPAAGDPAAPLGNEAPLLSDRATENEVGSRESDVPSQEATLPRRSVDEARRDSAQRAPATAPVAEPEDRVAPKARELAAPQAIASEAFAEADRDALTKALPTLDLGNGVQIRLSPTRVERTTDGGTSWTTEFADPAVALTTIACGDRDSCWAGGDGGLVLHREPDGTWSHRPLPAASSVTSINAVSAREATLTLADGRRYHTDDGGSSWHLLPD